MKYKNKISTSEWQGLTGASTSRTVPPIIKITLRDPPLRKKQTNKQTDASAPGFKKI